MGKSTYSLDTLRKHGLDDLPPALQGLVVGRVTSLHTTSPLWELDTISFPTTDGFVRRFLNDSSRQGMAMVAAALPTLLVAFFVPQLGDFAVGASILLALLGIFRYRSPSRGSYRRLGQLHPSSRLLVDMIDEVFREGPSSRLLTKEEGNRALELYERAMGLVADHEHLVRSRDDSYAAEALAAADDHLVATIQEALWLRDSIEQRLAASPASAQASKEQEALEDSGNAPREVLDSEVEGVAARVLAEAELRKATTQPLKDTSP